MTNWSASGMSLGGSPPEFRAGDRIWSGAAIAEIPDLSTALVACRVDEADRGRLRTGLTAEVRVDALPDTAFKGSVVDISALARLDLSGPRVRNFDLTVAMDRTDPRLRPGMSATVRLAVDCIEKAVLVPPAAVFARDGKTVAYVAAGRRFERREVEVLRRGPESVAVGKGVRPGDRVALRDPTVAEEGAER
ncbi:MAG: HlyD family efflux transporter periplasmic adaptor subunit [Acidobacteria bacterium]|nr:MAG: HlyD family efflux transporter periplasmic adaptor subunit [Acidobacteriota bacterium]RPJ81043.1 MAG: HlyD family efflux transporter periplasmic adaptor subunit [Acidobacteriota bacterium]